MTTICLTWLLASVLIVALLWFLLWISKPSQWTVCRNCSMCVSDAGVRAQTVPRDAFEANLWEMGFCDDCRGREMV